MDEKNSLFDVAFLQNIVEQVRDFIIIFDMQGKVLYANQATLHAYGYSAEEFNRLYIQDLRSAETRRDIGTQMMTAYQDGTLFRTVHIKKNGEQFPVEVNSKRFFYAEQEALVSIVRDITKASEVEITLRKNEEKYRLLHEELMVIHEELTASEEELRQQFDELMAKEEKIYRQNMVLSSLHEMSLGLMEDLDKDEVLKKIISGATELFAAPHGAVYLIDEEKGTFASEVGVGIFADITIKGNLTQGLVGQAYKTGQLLTVRDYSNWEHRLMDPILDDMHYFILVPLKNSTKMIGAFALSFSDPNRMLDEYEISLIRQFSDLASIALTDAILVASYKNEIGERRRKEEELRLSEEKFKVISMYDALTGTYNRNYFESKLASLKTNSDTSLAMVICDINGMKLVNDTLGHAAGDQLLKNTADILQSTVREGDVVARIGGDEFAIILPQAYEQVAEALCKRIRMKVDEYNQKTSGVGISLSVGYAVQTVKTDSIVELFREADDYMYREKLHHLQSVRSNMVQTAMKLLEVRDFATEGHAVRLQNMIIKLARKLGLREKRIADIRLLAKFHDIGKVGIPDHILLKPGRLTSEEKKEMQRHAEIGYRIAQASADLSPIAEWILKHHEWWNGEGYPLGLKEEDIPIECRLLAVVDAYDAMTSNRPYRKALKKEVAICELQRFAGSQFSSTLVDAFVDIVIGEGSSLAST